MVRANTRCAVTCSLVTGSGSLVTGSLVAGCLATSCLATSFLATSYRATSYRATSCRATSCRATRCAVTSLVNSCGCFDHGGFVNISVNTIALGRRVFWGTGTLTHGDLMSSGYLEREGSSHLKPWDTKVGMGTKEHKSVPVRKTFDKQDNNSMKRGKKISSYWVDLNEREKKRRERIWENGGKDGGIYSHSCARYEVTKVQTRRDSALGRTDISQRLPPSSFHITVLHRKARRTTRSAMGKHLRNWLFNL